MLIDIILVIIGGILVFTGIAGCLVPIIPGPPISYIAILLLHYSGIGTFSSEFLIIWAIATVLITIFDYIIPIWGTKLYGGTKHGVRGATLGLIIGVFLFPPIGLIAGPFIGALAFELIHKKDIIGAFRSAIGSLVGFLIGTGIKLFASLYMGVYFFKALF